MTTVLLSGIKPGGIHTGSRKRHRPDSFPMNTSARHTCPVINCGRVYENASLLDGHLKRYSFSPHFSCCAISFATFEQQTLEHKYFIFFQWSMSSVGLITLLVTQPSILKDVPQNCLPALHVVSTFRLRKHGEHISSQRLLPAPCCASEIISEETCFMWCCASQVSSSSPDGHSITQKYQCIVCFACPACYLFFNLRDECLQHMSARNHFTMSLPLTGKVY